MSKISFVIKRNGAKVKFNKDRIVNAIYRAAVELGERDRKIAEHLANQVVEKLGEINKKDHVPHIEEIQDIVEKILIKNGHAKLAKTYILYREEN
ncbi:MAG: response regulator SirA, partial [Candidatus Cloacimonetes bacterium]|nr:response regulator SirA [Candidatus Cloacimonadota bacterium]